MVASLTNIVPSIQRYWTGSNPLVCNAGQNYAVNDTVGDAYGGLYTVATTGAFGSVDTVTLTTAPAVIGGNPDPLVYTLPVSTSGLGLTLQLTWAIDGGYLSGIQGFTNSGGLYAALSSAASGSVSISATGIGSNATVSASATIAGAAVGQQVLVTPSVNPGNQFVWKGWVSGAGVVVVDVTNTTTSAAVASGTYNIKVL